MQKGDKIHWMQTCRGGYGMQRPVAAILQTTPTPHDETTLVTVLHRERGRVTRRVATHNLRTGRDSHVPGLDPDDAA